MYKFLIIIVAVMFIAAGGYYVDVAGGGIVGNIVMGNITTQDTLIPLSPDDIPGTYVCNTSATCKHKYSLVIKNDKTIELIRELSAATSSQNTPDTNQDNNEASNVDTTTEIGNWDLGVQNMLVITITGQGELVYDIPQKIVIKKVTAKTLSKISYTKNNYKDIISPIFIKQEQQ